MAQIIGSESKYIKDKRIEYRSISLGYLISTLLICLCVVLVLFKTFTQNSPTDLSIPKIALFLFIIFVICWVYLYIYSQDDLRARHFLSGLRGEQSVLETLNELPGTYTVIQDLLLKYGNIDFLITRDGKAILIEVKNHYGQITLGNNNQLLIDGVPFEKDLILQVARQKQNLRDYLFSYFKKDIPVIAILVFSNKGSFVEIPPKPIESLFITHRRMLNKLILNLPYIHSEIESENIINSLRPFIKSVSKK